MRLVNVSRVMRGGHEGKRTSEVEFGDARCVESKQSVRRDAESDEVGRVQSEEWVGGEATSGRVCKTRGANNSKSCREDRARATRRL